MRIAIVIPSDAFRDSAGARVRYQRLIDAAPAGSLTMVTVDELRHGFDGYLISKAYNAAIPAIAADLRRRGKIVGLDVFDDYFSHRTDPRLSRFWAWFDALAPEVDFLTVSTPALAARLGPCIAGPTLVVGDPAPAGESAHALAARLAARPVPDSRALHFGWFGIARNPHFQAGLADLAAFTHTLALSGRHRLSVLTNVEAAEEEALAALSAAPVRTTLAPWSEAAEAGLVAAVDAVLLPVNRQPFSTAKSLNRAITALCGGTQVISLGAPLYAPLEGFIYDSPAAFAADAELGRLRNRADRAEELAALLDRLASAKAGAAAVLGAFEAAWKARPRVRLRRGPRIAALRVGNGDVELLSQAGIVSVGVGGGPADILLGGRIRVSRRAAPLLPWGLRRRMEGGALPLTALDLAAEMVSALKQPTAPSEYAARVKLLPAARAATACLLPNHRVVIAHRGTLQ